MWVVLGVLSAIFLGLYDICKKHALKDNDVLTVLFLGLVSGSIMVLPTIIFSPIYPEFMKNLDIYVPQLSIEEHGAICIKSLIITFSWIFAYYSLKHLPISIASPLKAMGPFFTVLGALLIFHENPNYLQWIGFIIIIVSFIWFSRIGKNEGIVFRKNKWVLFALLATIATSASGLYDKYLIQTSGMHPQTVQTWFAIYLVIIQGMVILIAKSINKKPTTKFKWRWSIPFIGILLIIADFIYFRALTYPTALILLLSGVKRIRILIATIIGGIIFKEVNKGKKTKALLFMLIGVLIIIYAS